MFSPSSPVTGSAQTGLTSPTYTLTADNAPSLYAKQYAITAIGGTQSGVNTHTVGAPFTVTMFRAAKLKVPGTANSSGVVSSFPTNTHKIITRKSAAASSNSVNPQQTIIIRTEIVVPAGTDTVSPAEVRAALSCHIGVLNQQSAGIGDTAITGVL